MSRLETLVLTLVSALVLALSLALVSPVTIKVSRAGTSMTSAGTGTAAALLEVTTLTNGIGREVHRASTTTTATIGTDSHALASAMTTTTASERLALAGLTISWSSGGGCGCVGSLCFVLWLFS